MRGTRKRKSPTDSNLVSYVTYEDDEEQDGVLAAFSTALSAPRPDRQHRDDLPPEPKTWKEMLNHTFSEGFLAAAGLEIESLRKRETVHIKPRPQDRSIQVLPLTWVFTYKFDSNGKTVAAGAVCRIKEWILTSVRTFIQHPRHA